MDATGLLLGTLMQSRNQAHIYHLQVQGPSSFAAHKALQEYYEGIIPLIDTVAENIQGRYGIITGYRMPEAIREDGSAKMYFEGLSKFVETLRQDIPQDSYIQNDIDTIVGLIESTKYKLTFLQ